MNDLNAKLKAVFEPSKTPGLSSGLGEAIGEAIRPYKINDSNKKLTDALKGLTGDKERKNSEFEDALRKASEKGDPLPIQTPTTIAKPDGASANE